MRIKNETCKAKIILLVIPRYSSEEGLFKFVKEISQNKVCYVTLNKGFSALKNTLNGIDIKLDKFFFIDCVTESIVNQKSVTKNTPQCIYLPSPNEITSISSEITKCIDNSFQVVLIDSISTLLAFHKEGLVINFMTDLINKGKDKENTTLIFIISKRHKETKLFKKMQGLADKVTYTYKFDF